MKNLKTFIPTHKEEHIPKNTPHKNNLKTKKGKSKMAKAAMKNRIKKMNFQKQEREMIIKPLSDDDKYIIQLAGHRRDMRSKYENILRTTGRAQRSQHI
jgi:hypothetical protein